MNGPEKVEVTSQTFWLQRVLIQRRFILRVIGGYSFVLVLVFGLFYFVWVDLFRHSLRIGFAQAGHFYLTNPEFYGSGQVAKPLLEVSAVEFYVLWFLQSGFVVSGTIVAVAACWGLLLKSWGYDDV